jgi:DNA-binding NarL/FixJ family response regulator
MSMPVFRALVVEDDPSWQQILGEILSDLGLGIDIAGNLKEALHALKTESHRLAVVDLSLEASDHSNSDGLRVLDAAHRLDPACRTILLTGFATIELAVSTLTEYGAFTFLRKETFQRSQFRQVVDRILAAVPAPLEPVSGSENSPITSSVEPDDAIPPYIRKVLVVEDDAGWRSILAEILADAGRQVRLCGSFGDALGCLRREKYGLAVVDLSLAGEMNWDRSTSNEPLEGYELLANTHSAGIPTIVVSGIASVEEIRRAYTEHSIFAYMEKQSFDRATFIRLIEEASQPRTITNELDRLTDREREVFDLLARGMTNKEIAETLVVSINTIKRHLKSIFEKLNVHTRSAAASRAGGAFS